MAIWSTSNDEGFNERLHEICFKTNLDYDDLLLPYDLKALIAHGRMLVKQELISGREGEVILENLQEMHEECEKGLFKMSEEWEDCHSLIEAELIRRAGDAGKRLYMARSRNDQVVCATRLYTKEALKNIKSQLKDLMSQLLSKAKQYEFAPMPGYTHTQRAMPSSAGMWLSSYLEILLNQQACLKAAIYLNDVNTLGSAAGYGTGFPVDREMVTTELGLAKTQINSLSCQLSRGQVECQTLQNLWGIMFVINRLANDMVWLSSAEFDFLKIHKSCTTGSSIMPNKQNLDPCEIIRGRYHIFTGYINQLQGTISNLFYGYNSDYQETKAPLMEGLKLVREAIEVMTIIVANTDFQEDQMLAKFDSDIFSTDEVNRQVLVGKTFRDAYQEVKKQLDEVKTEDALQNIKSKTHLGATGNLGLSQLSQQLEKF